MKKIVVDLERGNKKIYHIAQGFKEDSKKRGEIIEDLLKKLRRHNDTKTK
jgi:hypothetical protein